MQFTMSASGTPAQVRESIGQQAKSHARDAAVWPTAAAVRDHVTAALEGVPADQTVSVSVTCTVTITGAERPKAAGAVTSVATGTVGVEGKAVAVVGEDRVIRTEPAEVSGDGSGEALPAFDPSAERTAPAVGDAPIGRRASDRSGNSK